MCRKCGLYRRSRAQGPETLPFTKTSRAQDHANLNANRNATLARPRRSPPFDSLNGLNFFLPLLEPSSETLSGNHEFQSPGSVFFDGLGFVFRHFWQTYTCSTIFAKKGRHLEQICIVWVQVFPMFCKTRFSSDCCE